eukprot:TRINITY_DN114933_c0_g1_i1.p1 TRINITY_DN114933_c0_g1~~TRINITY_DN114933_c0_g1_i1.p1  ORF type:complete len:168 (-),score=3.78 TRINITY_DN114933_c0_g1_i1:8-511(-)
MKKVSIALFSASLVLASCGGTKTSEDKATSQEKEPIETVDYGPEKVDPSAAVSVAAMMSDFKANGSTEKVYTVEGEITQVCAKAGCWVKIVTQDEPFMVRFKDHFTIPTDTPEGTMAILHGRAYVDTVSVDLLRHFAEDAGESPEEIAKITEPEVNFGFEADGIRLL